MILPDLRPEHEITLEHCSVLLERLKLALRAVYPGDPEEWSMICDAINPEMMRRDIMSMFDKTAFQNLFGTELGKGVLVGAFAQKFLTDGEEF